tara:strand:+ start:3081 stop:3467 length:387 start_codon:yes stop_codon:yes gene_type:complete
MEIIIKLLVSFLFGGMSLFSFGFAIALLKQMEISEARKIIRSTFPMYYKLVIIVSIFSSLISAPVNTFISLSMAGISITTLYARQVLMHQINAATDSKNTKLFKQLHTVSVIIQLLQIGLLGYWIATL